MPDDQKYDLHLYAGVLTGFVFGFWRGLLLLQQEMDELCSVELDRVTSSLIGLQPLGHACIFAILGGWLFVRLYQNSVGKAEGVEY